jgi:hypothetical protein
MNCKICEQGTKGIFSAKILTRYDSAYYLCPNCGFLQTDEPTWLEEAYKESINILDTGIIARNNFLAEQTATILYYFFDCNARYLDFAGGYGVFTRLMRDIGFDFYWHDLYTKNLVARGFEWSDDNVNAELITSFESFEHFVNPLVELKKMLSISENIFFSTELLPNPIPNPRDWWYYGVEHGQHVSFYSYKTLQYIADMFGLNLYSNGISLHLLTSKKLSNFRFKRVMKFKKHNLYPKVVKQMKSKTVDDMILLTSKLCSE